MYELIIRKGKSSYCLFGDSLDIADYPTIPVGSWVFIPDTGDLFFINGPKSGLDLDEPSQGSDSSSSVFGRGVIGELIFGE